MTKGSRSKPVEDEDEELYEGKHQNVLHFKTTVTVRSRKKHSTSMIDWALEDEGDPRRQSALDYLRMRYAGRSPDDDESHRRALRSASVNKLRMSLDMSLPSGDRLARIAKLRQNVRFIEGKFKDLLKKTRRVELPSIQIGDTSLMMINNPSPTPSLNRPSRFENTGEALKFFKSRCRTIIIVGVWINTIKDMNNDASWQRELQTFLNLMISMPEANLTAPFETEGGIVFDRNDYRTNREISLSADVKTILSIRPEGRTPHMIQKVKLGLQTLKSLCEYPLDTQEQICRVAWFQQVPASKYIIRQGHKPEAFYFIISGLAVVQKIDAGVVARLTRGQSFGELGLIFKAPRSATVESASPMELLVVGKEDFLKIFMHNVAPGQDASHISFLKHQPVLKHWNFNALKEDPSCCLINYFKRGSLVSESAKKSEWIYFIKSGTCDALKRLKAVTPRTEKQIKINYYKDNIENRVPDHTGKYVLDKGTQPKPLHPDLYRSITGYFNEIRRFEESKRRKAIIDKLKEEKGNESRETKLFETSSFLFQRFPEEKLPCVLPPIPSRKIEGSGVSGSKFDVYSAINGTDSFSIPAPSSLQNEMKMKIIRPPDWLDPSREKKDDVFVTLDKLQTRDIFGMNTVVFPDDERDDGDTDVALVSNGAEIVMLSKKLFVAHANERVKLAVHELTTKYPREEHLVENLQTRANWHTYRRQLVSGVVRDKGEGQGVRGASFTGIV